MADQKASELTTIPAVDRATDLLYIVDTSGGTSNKTTANQLLSITGAPVGDTDIQTLTNKTLTAPAISSPVLSGTLTGTYTLGGTPTFPSAVVTLTGSQTLTNKTLTSPTINTATIVNPTLTTDTVSEYTSANGVTVDGLNIKDGVLNTNNSVVTANMTDSSVTNAKVDLGMSVQTVATNFSAVSTTTTLLPYDDTIPQNTEGAECMTQSITPKSATNILSVSATVMMSSTIATFCSIALFQDTTANALAANSHYQASVTGSVNLTLTHKIVAGTTSPTTFKIRFGGQDAGTFTFNGSSGNRRFGGITVSNITITEYKAS